MKYVNYLMSITTGLCLAFILGCTKAPVEVNSLGLKLSAPQLKSSSPFEQDMESNGFVVLSGTCNKMMTKFSVSFDGSNYYEVPPTTPYTISGSSNSKSNKVDCSSDGSFEFYISDDLIEGWTGTADIDVKKIHIRSEGPLGISNDLIIVKTNENNGDKRITHLKTLKRFPEGLVGENTCGVLSISLEDANGNERSSSQAVKFSLTEVGAGNEVSFFSNMVDCQNSVSTGTTTNSISRATIQANSSRTEIYYHFVYSGAGTSITLQANNITAGLNLTPISTTVEKKDSSAISKDRWLDFSGPMNIYKNICIEGRVALRKFDATNSEDTSHTSLIGFGIVSTDAKLKFYSDSNCGTEITTMISLPAYTSWAQVYYKYNEAAISVGSVDTVSLIAANGAYRGGFEISGSLSRIHVDLDNSRSSITQLQFEGPNAIEEYSCQKYQVRGLNSHYATVANASATPVAFDLNVSALGTFFSDSGCTSSPITQESFATSEQSKTVYFKVNGTIGSTLQATMTATPIISTQMNVAINPVASKILLAKTDVTPSYSTLAAGYHFLCANNTSGATSCTGFSAAGQLGNGDTSGRSSFNFNSPIGSFVKMDLGLSHACGITSDKKLFCWGNNIKGQIGNNSSVTQNTPVQILTDVEEISAGNQHTCAITTSGELRCWGGNAFAQIGDGTSTDRLVPTSIGSGFVKVSAGINSTCAIKDSGDIYCWGSDNSNSGALGLGAIASQLTPNQVSTGIQFNNISVGANYACAISAANELYCWGSYLLDSKSTTPVKVNDIQVKKISLSTDDHACLIDINDEVYCWGNNSNGQIGNNSNTSPVTTLTKVSGNHKYAEIVAGDTFTCGLRIDSGKQLLNCWGSNYYGQYGTGQSGVAFGSLVPFESHCFKASFQSFDFNLNIRSINNNYVLVSTNVDSNSALIGTGSCTDAISSSLTIGIGSGQSTSSEFYFRQTKSPTGMSFSLSGAPAYLAPPPSLYLTP